MQMASATRTAKKFWDYRMIILGILLAVIVVFVFQDRQNYIERKAAEAVKADSIAVLRDARFFQAEQERILMLTKLDSILIELRKKNEDK